MKTRPEPAAKGELEWSALARAKEPLPIVSRPDSFAKETQLELLPSPALELRHLEKAGVELPESEQASLQRAIFTAMHAVEPLTEEEAALPHNEGVSHFATNGGQKFQARFLQDGGCGSAAACPSVRGKGRYGWNRWRRRI